MIQFEKIFNTWLHNTLTTSTIPANVTAYCFNLASPAGHENDGIFDIQLIGAPQFLPNDEDWACDAVWEPIENNLLIPLSYSTKDWEVCLDKMHQLIKQILVSENDATKLLKRSEAVAIGFVDGDLKLIWVNPMSNIINETN